MTTSTSTSTARPAATAAARISRATLAIGGLGLAMALFLATRVTESWRIDGHGNSFTLLGQRLSYPAANAGAIVIIALAALGIAVSVTAVLASAGELGASRRLRRALGRHVGATLADGTIVIEDPMAHAFCAGLLRPRIYITTAAIARLDPSALEAVLSHERHHARRRDPLRLATGRVLARSLFFIPWLGRLHERHQILAELGADEHAASAGAPALARALLTFEQSGIDPLRIDRLLAVEPPAWRFPAALALAAAGAIALLATAAALAARVASGTATLAPPLLSRQPCVVVLAAIPTLVTLWSRRLARMRL